MRVGRWRGIADMPLTYVKLANVTADLASSPPIYTRAALLADIAVVNLKGRILTATEMANHLDGVKDGETVAAFVGTDAER